MKTWRWAALAAIGLGMVACQPIDETGGTGGTGGTSDSNSAWINVTNNLEKFPGPVSVLLYAPTAPDVDAASTNLGVVAESTTVKLPVPAGDWRLGMKDESGTVSPLLAPDGSGTWTTVQVTTGSTYNLILFTDEVNNDTWTSSLAIVSP